MKIIQSFWTGKRCIPEHSFGWYSPEYHLMSWTLSCLNLRQHYETVELYTDRHGYEWLIEELELPYTKVHVTLDDLNQYPSELWALAKAKAYTTQEQPFIHTDGDVFIWNRFAKSIHNAALVVQNIEQATDYYESKFLDVKRYATHLPEIIHVDRFNQPVCSCNAGIIGGSDVSYFKEYDSRMFEIVDGCQISEMPTHVMSNFNIFFEQVLFYNLAKQRRKPISCLIDRIFDDNGYKHDDFADFTKVPFLTQYLHLLGPNKRDYSTCDLMSRFLLQFFPKYYFKIKALFKSIQSCPPGSLLSQSGSDIHDDRTLSCSTTPNQPLHTHLQVLMLNKLQSLSFGADLKTRNPASNANTNADNPIIAEAANYRHILVDAQNEFRLIPFEKLLARDIRSTERLERLYLPEEDFATVVVQTDPAVKLFETRVDWTILCNEVEGLSNVDEFPKENIITIACLPEFEDPYYRQVIVDQLDYYILSLAASPLTIKTMFGELKACFDADDIANNYEGFLELIRTKIKSLITKKCLFFK